MSSTITSAGADSSSARASAPVAAPDVANPASASPRRRTERSSASSSTTITFARVMVRGYSASGLGEPSLGDIAPRHGEVADDEDDRCEEHEAGDRRAD